MISEVSTQQTGGYQTTTSSASLKIKATTAALKWLCNTHAARVIINFDYRFMLRRVQNEWVKLPYVATQNLNNLYGFTVQNGQVFVVMIGRTVNVERHPLLGHLKWIKRI